jgi:hypothetical protein
VLNVEERIGELLKNVIDIITNKPRLDIVVKLVRKAFEDFGMKLRQICLGSLVFVFEHSVEGKDADWLQRDENARGRIIKYLQVFLPDWAIVCARWEVRTVSATECDLSSLSKQGHVPVGMWTFSEEHNSDPGKVWFV